MKPRRAGGSFKAEDLGRLHRDVGNLFDLLSPSHDLRAHPIWGEMRFFPRVNVQERSDAFVVRCEIPGVAAKDLDIRFDGGTLIIKGARNPDTVDDDASFHRRERTIGEFQRCIAIPGEVDQKTIRATYRDGVLTVDLAKREKNAAKRIRIDSA